MNKVYLTIISILSVVGVVFFFMWKSVYTKNQQLTIENNNLTTQIESIQATLSEREAIIREQDKKYRDLINSINYNECENLPVSETLLEAAKELQK